MSTTGHSREGQRRPAPWLLGAEATVTVAAALAEFVHAEFKFSLRRLVLSIEDRVKPCILHTEPESCTGENGDLGHAFGHSV